MKMKEGRFYTSYLLPYGHEGFPGGASGKDSAYQCRRYKRPRFNPWVRKIPWRECMAIHSSILAWKIPRTKEPEGYSPWGHKEPDTTEHARVSVNTNGNMR